MKQPIFYCQLDHPEMPYPSPTSPHGTIADNGCGVCAASMLVENMLGLPFSLEESAKLATACGAREGFGTDFFFFAKALAERFPLAVTDTEDAAEAMAFLRAGRGMVVANTYGDREGYTGVFSDGGHYILLIAAQGSDVAVLDSCYRPGRYDVPGRAGKVRMEGNVAWADASIIRDDCRERPFFLFSPKE